MSEQTTEAATEAEPAEGPSAAGPARTTNRKTVVMLAAGLALAVLAGGGFLASARLDEADRTSPTRYWRPDGVRSDLEPKPVPTVPPTALAAKLLPMDAGDQPGPDLDGEGNDFYVPGERALQTFKNSRSGLSEEERAGRDKALAGLKLKGVAGRSFTTFPERSVSEIELMQADSQAVASLAEVDKKVLAVLEKLGERTGNKRQVPAVDGFPQAKCVLSNVVGDRPDDIEKKDKLDSLDCVAAEGDVLVTFRTYGAAIAVNQAVDLFEKQLTRLETPGESA
ncbi:hypothetical protein ABZ934_19260 [Streptomyces sp. NPDC046557]|uniref:hypothetical protein n=1 Tax=Streptomyces sp. NPDC046557 TaxID=3155372 RepID=UPI00340C6B10